MASWEYFIYSKSGRYSPEDIAQKLISKGYENGITCKTTAKQEISIDHFMVLGERFEENINVPQGKEGVVFSSGNGNEEDIKNIFNLFQRRDIEVKLSYKFGDIDYKSYFEDAPLEINGKTYFAKLKSEKEMMSQSHTPGMHFSNQKEFEDFTRFNDTRYHFYNCTFDDIHFSENVVIGQLERCRFNRCTFENFDAEDICFNNSVLTQCRIINCNLKSCNFESIGLYQSQISKSNFTNANFAAADIKQTRFDENNLSAIKLHGALLNGVHITKSTINNPVEGLYIENITWGGATPQEIEVNRNRIFSELKLEPVAFAQELENTASSLEPLTETHIKNANNNFSLSNNHPANELVDEHEFYKPSISPNEKVLKLQQYTIINEFNPSPNTYQTWIRSAADIKTFEDALKNSDYTGWEQNGFDESYSASDAENALKSGRITVYSSHPIEQGVFVTPSPMEARSYSGDGNIYSKEVSLNAVAWIDPTQGQYANVEEYAAQTVSEAFSGLESKTIEPFANEILENKIESQKLTLEEYLAQRGLASPVDDFMIDKLKLPHGQSKYDERKMHENARKSSREYHEKRNAAIQEYQEKVAAGEIIEPSVEERYIKKAMGNPDKQSVQAARRVLEKRGYIQNENGEWIKSSVAQNQAIEPTFAEQKVAEVKEKISNPQPITKSLTREEFDKLTSEISDIAKNYQADPKLAAEYFSFKAQFYQYSPNNALLIHMQNPHATFVASFTKWKDMGYSLKKGAKHMKISRPIEIAKFPREVNGKTTMVDVKNANAEEKAKIANGEIEVKKIKKFVPHQVFDISQTTCPPEDYPKIFSRGYENIEQAQLYECIKEYAKDSGFSVVEEDMSSISLNGYYMRDDDSIHINSTLQDSKKLETIAHELAHGVLHKTSTQPTEIKEFEAESFGTMLKRKLGFPVSDESKRYIQSYFMQSKLTTGGKFNMDDTLNRLSKVFKHISTGIDNKIEEMGYGSPREAARSLQQARTNAIDPVKISSNFTQAL